MAPEDQAPEAPERSGEGVSASVKDRFVSCESVGSASDEDEDGLTNQGSPYHRPVGPKTPETERRHADAGEKLVRLASQFPTGDGALGESDPDGSSNTVIIFDWDDTLFPTWFVSEVVMPCLPPEAKAEGTLPEDSPFHEALTRHGRLVRTLLASARSIGRVGIVTLAQRPWVLTSAHRFLPGIDLKQILKENEIPVIYARECLRRPMVSQAKIEEGVNVFTVAKQAAMLKALKKLYGKRPWTNVISIGDSIVERDAITELLWSHGQDSDGATCCKTVKLMDEPSAEQLQAELVLLERFLPNMSAHAEDFDVIMDDPEELMSQFISRFGT